MRKYPILDTPYQLDPETLPRRDDGVVDWGIVFGADRPLRVEIGVGNSPFLIEVARLEPGFNYLGFEYSNKRVLKFLKKVHKAELENIRMLRLNALELLRRFQPDSIDHVFVNFPDPWPKKRHARRRFVQPDSTRVLVARMRPGAGYSLRTDAAFYAEQMLRVLDAEAELENLAGDGSFADAPKYPFETPYEIKFKAEGRHIHYLEYRRRRGDGE